MLVLWQQPVPQQNSDYYKIEWAPQAIAKLQELSHLTTSKSWRCLDKLEMA